MPAISRRDSDRCSVLTRSTGSCRTRRRSGRGSGYFPPPGGGTTTSLVSSTGTIFTNRSCSARYATRRAHRGSRSASPVTPSVTPSRRTCSSAARTSAPCRSSSATATSRRRCDTCTCWMVVLAFEVRSTRSRGRGARRRVCFRLIVQLSEGFGVPATAPTRLCLRKSPPAPLPGGFSR